MSFDIFSTKVLIGDTIFILPFADVTTSDIEEAAPQKSLTYLNDNEIEIEIEIESVLIRDFPEGVFFRVFYRNLALLHLRVLLLPFIVLFQNKHTKLAKNGENLVSA